MNTTLVTGFYDINRGNWSSYKRSVDDYMRCFSKISTIETNMVIYCEEKNYEKIQKIRPESETTKIIVREFAELDFYKEFYNKTKEVMQKPSFRNKILYHDIPEMIYPEYNIINFNKISLVKESLNLFNSEVYGWIDFGYGTGNVSIKYDEDHIKKMVQDDKIYMVALRPIPEDNYFYETSFFNNIVYITGSCFIGSKNSMEWFYKQIKHVIHQCLDYDLIDDDQTIYNIVYLNFKDKFNIKYSNWFTHFQK